MENSYGLLPYYKNAYLDRLHPKTPKQLKDLRDKYQAMTKESFYKKKPNIYLYGLSRRGKTWLLHAIAHMIINKYEERSIAYITSPALMRAFIQPSEDENGESMISIYAGKKVLIVDDFGQEYKPDTRFIENRYEEFFRWRFNHDKITMIGSNATMNAIEEIFGGSFANFLDGEFLTIEVDIGEDISKIRLEEKWT
jgi:DNA replication protein DnaC